MDNQEQITTSNQDKSKDLTKVIFLKKLISDANDECYNRGSDYSGLLTHQL